MNRNRAAAGLASLFAAVLIAACTGSVVPEELPSPTATGIPSPFPPSYAWVRAQLDGELRGEFVVGDPQDSFERVRGRVEGAELVVEIGFQSRNLSFRTPPLRGGSRYIIRGGEGILSLTVDGTEWSTSGEGACSVIFSHVRGSQIPFLVPQGYQIYEADAGFVCTGLESPLNRGSKLSVIDGAMHFFFVVPAGSREASRGEEDVAQRISTGTIPPTG